MSIEQFRRDYQIAPILLINGIAASAIHGQMSVLSLTEGQEDVVYASVDDYFAHFKPIPGGTIVDFSFAEYPFASMSMAANAAVQNALKFSLRMECPVRTGRNSYPAIQAIITRLQQQLTAHILAGGSFTVATPGVIYQNCLLTGVRDITSAADKKVQQAFQWDFIQPLVTQQAATQTYNNLYNKLANLLPVSNPPTNSGVSTSIGNAAANQPPSPVQGSGPISAD